MSQRICHCTRVCTCVFSVSVKSVRTSPFVVSASLAVEFLWNRSVETNPSFVPSGLHRYSPMSMLSSDIARWKSGAVQQARHLAGVDVDDDAADHGDVGIAGQRVLPRAEDRMAAVDRRLDQVHVADLPLVLLLRRDLLAVGRPRQRRRGAGDPARVARRVAEVLRAVGRELALLAGGDVLHPEIPVADEQRLAAVGRHRRRRRTAQSR